MSVSIAVDNSRVLKQERISLTTSSASTILEGCENQKHSKGTSRIYSDVSAISGGNSDKKKYPPENIPMDTSLCTTYFLSKRLIEGVPYAQQQAPITFDEELSIPWNTPISEKRLVGHVDTLQGQRQPIKDDVVEGEVNLTVIV